MAASCVPGSSEGWKISVSYEIGTLGFARRSLYLEESRLLIGRCRNIDGAEGGIQIFSSECEELLDGYKVVSYLFRSLRKVMGQSP